MIEVQGGLLTGLTMWPFSQRHNKMEVQEYGDLPLLKMSPKMCETLNGRPLGLYYHALPVPGLPPHHHIVQWRGVLLVKTEGGIQATVRTGTQRDDRLIFPEPFKVKQRQERNA